MTDTELLKEALKALGEDASLEQITKWVRAKKDLMAVEQGDDAPAEEATEEAPEPEAAMSSDDDEATEASTGDEEPTEAGAEEVPDAELMDPEADAAAEAIVSALEQISGGKSRAEIAAAIQEQPDAFAELLGASPAEGTPPEQGAMSTDEPAAESDNDAIALLTKQVQKLSERIEAQETEKRTAAEKAEAERKLSQKREVEAEVDRFIVANLVEKADRAKYVKLGTESPDSYAILSAPLRKLCSDTTPPQGRVYEGPGHVETLALSDQDHDPEQERHLRATLAKTGIADVDGAVKRHFARLNGSRG